LYDNDFRVHPRVCRIRDLLGPDPLRPLAEHRKFNRCVYEAVAVPGGRCFIVNGWHDGPDDRFRAIAALDGLSGRELWSCRYEGGDDETRWSLIACTEDHVVIRLGGVQSGTLSLRSVINGNRVRSLDHWPGEPDHDWKRFLGRFVQSQGVSLHGADNRLLVNLGIDQRVVGTSKFSPDGKCAVWGNPDGSVMVADLEEIQARLGRVGLSWAPARRSIEK
jgi:hypothetical protein